MHKPCHLFKCNSADCILSGGLVRIKSFRKAGEFFEWRISLRQTGLFFRFTFVFLIFPQTILRLKKDKKNARINMK